MPTRGHDEISQIISDLRGIAPRLNRPALDRFLEELLRWNPDLGLVSRRSTKEVTARLIRQSVEMWDALTSLSGHQTGARWRVVDIGSGGGFPGVVWKCLAPKLRLALVERKQNRAVFLERVVRRLGLEETAVLENDLRELARQPEHKEAFEVAVALAVAAPRNLARDVERVLRPGGYFTTLRAAADPQIDTTIGATLFLAGQTETGSGIHLLYQKPRPKNR